jgi:hypothetical protein
MFQFLPPPCDEPGNNPLNDGRSPAVILGRPAVSVFKANWLGLPVYLPNGILIRRCVSYAETSGLVVCRGQLF